MRPRVPSPETRSPWGSRWLNRKPKRSAHPRTSNRIRKWAASGSAVAVLASGSLLMAGAAYGATTGPGYEGITPEGGALVQYVAPDGSWGTCFDSGRDWPSGPTGGWSVVTSLTTDKGDVVSGDTLKRLNYEHSSFAAGKYGDRYNNDVAAADAAYTYAWSSTWGHYNGYGYNAGLQKINGNAGVKAVFDQIWNDTEANFAGGGNGASGGVLSFNLNPTNNYKGTLTVNLNNPAATGIVKLTNGKFDATGTNTASVKNGDVLSVRGVAPDGAKAYKISAHGDFTGPGGVKAEIAVALTNDPAQQRIIKGTGATSTVSFSLDAYDPMNRSAVFQPAASSQVPSLYVKKGETFKDSYTFSTVADAAGLNNPWRTYSDGHYAIANGDVTLYGPFTSDPALNPQPTPPVGAPVVATGTVTTTAKDGPTIAYPLDFGVKATESGYYTAVIVLDASKMPAETQATIPAGYSYAEPFGSKPQTQTVPSDISFSTKLDQSEVSILGSVIDTITPSLSGGAWLIVDGKRVSVPLVQNVYYSATEIKQAPTAPSGAELIGTYHAALTGPDAVQGESISAGERAGYITVQTCIDVEAMPEAQRGLVNTDTPCDGYGIPNETAKVNAPGIQTHAQTDQTGWKVRDNVTTTGPGKVTDLKNGLDAGLRAYYIAPGAKHECTVDNEIKLDETKSVVHFDQDGTKASDWFDLSAEKLIQKDAAGNPTGGIQFTEQPSTTDDAGNIVELPANPDACNVASEYTELIKSVPPKPETPAVPPTPTVPAVPTTPTALAQTGSDVQSALIIGGIALGAIALGFAFTAVKLRRRNAKQDVESIG